ncbi:MAG: hypothetical protein M3453_00500 [Pseudomonadota bacterium]|nr:hypothetical protein [Pseudomonadota bacterium]
MTLVSLILIIDSTLGSSVAQGARIAYMARISHAGTKPLTGFPVAHAISRGGRTGEYHGASRFFDAPAA